MKKILQINTVCGTGSTGRIVQDIGEVIKKNNMESYIAYGYGKSNLEDSVKIGTIFEYYIHNILSRILCMQGRFSYFATKRFLKKVDLIKPDLIHLHNIHGNYINYKLLFKYIREKEIPVVWTLHDCWAFTGKCTYFDAINCNKWQTGCEKCKNLKDYPESYLLSNTKKEYENKKQAFTSVKDITFVTPSNWLKTQLSKSFLNMFPVKVINNGIDLKAFIVKKNDLRKRLKIDKKIVLLGVASDWTNRKGLNDFLKLRKLLDARYAIILIGLSKKQIKCIPNNIIKIPKTNSIQELADFYSISDLFINPTIEDNFPTTNLEALACGTPVITYDTGGSSEAVSPKCGCIVKKGDIMEMVNAIKTFDFNSKTRENCFARSRKYNKYEKFEEYIKLYHDCLKKGEV